MGFLYMIQCRISKVTTIVRGKCCQVHEKTREDILSTKKLSQNNSRVEEEMCRYPIFKQEKHLFSVIFSLALKCAQTIFQVY